MVFNTSLSSLMVQDAERRRSSRPSDNLPDGGTLENRLVGTDGLIQRWISHETSSLLKGISLQEARLKFFIEKLENSTGNLEKWQQDSS